MGGNITITADGDGIDSNGFLNVSGGTIYINGPTSNGDGALDYESTATITGGTVVAAGSSGMAENFGESSTQGTILYNFSSQVSGEVTLTDSDGNVIASFTPSKTYQSVVISSPEITNSGTYTISSGGESEEITMTSYVYSNGGGQMGFGGGRMGGNKMGSQGDGMGGNEMDSQGDGMGSDQTNGRQMNGNKMPPQGGQMGGGMNDSKNQDNSTNDTSSSDDN